MSTTMQMQQQETRISDFAVCCYLISIDTPLARVEGPRGRRVFVFTNAIVDFLSDRARVHPRKLLDAVRNVKALINEI